MVDIEEVFAEVSCLVGQLYQKFSESLDYVHGGGGTLCSEALLLVDQLRRLERAKDADDLFTQMNLLKEISVNLVFRILERESKRLPRTDALRRTIQQQRISSQNRANANQKRKDDWGAFNGREDYLEKALQALKEMVLSGQYPDWNHIEFLEELHLTPPFDSHEIPAWREELRQRFINLLETELNRPEIVRRH